MSNKSEIKMIDGEPHKLVFCKYIVVNGKRRYPKGKCFCFWAPVNKAS